MYRIFTKSFVVAENVTDFCAAKAIALGMDQAHGSEFIFIVRTDASHPGDVVLWKVTGGKPVAIGTIE